MKTREKELLEALRWLAEMAGYAQYETGRDWRRLNGSDYDDALAKARVAIYAAEAGPNIPEGAS
jgi:hypothetical protein